MQPLLDAINSLQAAPFAINEPVLEFMKRNSPPVPPAPNERQRWARKEYAKELAERTAYQMDFVMAEVQAEQERFFVSSTIDFRGRLYGLSHFNFARHDRIRALFLFADGEPIGEEGLLWLKAHVAARTDGNSWSAEKKPSRLNFAQRIAWTDNNLDKLRNVCRAVLHGETLTDDLPSDEPYQFIAACVELVQALDAGPAFITRLPLTFDGSCSGLQHLCAMTRAEEGRYVNLVAADNAEDFYSLVAAQVWRDNPELQHLMEGPNDRQIAKKPIMTFFYGSIPGGFARCKSGRRWKPYGMTEQVIEVLRERGKPTTGADRLAAAIYKAIEDLVPPAKKVRQFLEDLVRLCAKENKPLRWTTPLGLPVHNRYHKPKIKNISIPQNGRARRSVKFAVGYEDKINRRKAVNSVTANFVHSVDAAHLQLIALAAAKEGIRMVSVHDCFGCLAPHAKRFNGIIREQFVRLHKYNLLAEAFASAKRDLRRGVELPLPPEPGSLELELVLNSFHAFK
jgi:DNA-directed RNA polymerase